MPSFGNFRSFIQLRLLGLFFAFGLFLGLLKPGEDVDVFQGGGIALDRRAGSHLFQEPAHKFAGAGFGKGFGKAHVIRLGDGADDFAGRCERRQFLFCQYRRIPRRFRSIRRRPHRACRPRVLVRSCGFS